jgi:DNA-binding MarR family transcriptional regulator
MQDLPLSTLLSQTLVAFTIEFDNEFEHRAPHRTTSHASTPGAPWLVSMVLWQRLLQFVPLDGITAGELYRLTPFNKGELRAWLTRLSRRWGYLTIERPSAASTPAQYIICPTEGGFRAQEMWRPLTGIIVERWRDRFGHEAIYRLTASLQALIDKQRSGLPGSLPVLGFDMRTKAPAPKPHASAEPTLSALLANALYAFALDFEHQSEMPLAIGANLLRLAGPEGVRIRDLPRLSGISKEAVAMAVERLAECGFATVESERSGSRARSLHLTASGSQTRARYIRRLWEIEKRWETNFGDAIVATLRKNLEDLVIGETGLPPSPLFLAIEPYPDNWRAAVPPLETLPHYPMILHRGGFPDGA